MNVGVATTLAGDTVNIPLILSAPETIQVGSVVETISFPKKLLSLTRAELGPAGEESQATIKAKTTDDSRNPDLSLLAVTISGKGRMQPGVLAYLRFKVSTDAKKGTIPLKVVDSKATTASGQPLPMAKGKDGEIGVFNTMEEIPVIGCFFFTH